jgi:hypothetical protein
MLYKFEYCSLKVFVPSHLSVQNLISLSFYNIKFPKIRNYFLAFIWSEKETSTFSEQDGTIGSRPKIESGGENFPSCRTRPYAAMQVGT